MSNFVHLHNHTEYSFLDGAIRIKDMVRKTVEWGMPALAITDHGGLFGAIEFYDTCSKAGIKPVLGFEAYVAPRSRFEKSSSKDERNYSHLILLARNQQGWQNLMKLSSAGYLEGFYYKPRIDMEILREHSEGIIASSACVAGAIPQKLLQGDRDGARMLAEEYVSMFGEGNFYFELQDHGMEDETIAFKQLIELGKEMGIPFIVTNDAHYLKKEDAESHEVLLCLQTGNTLSNPNRFRFPTNELFFKSPDEMSRLFPELPEAMSNTLEIARRCDVKVHEKPQLPVPEVPPQYTDATDYLKGLAQQGLEKKYDEITPRLQERLDYELDIIISMGFVGYFLIVRDFVIEADRQGVARGCRGSAAGSLVAYCIDITNVDPIKFDLIFERFLNPERISMPDADIDFADNDRYRIIEYVVQKYGREAVCQIINFGRMKAKMIVKDVARAMEIPIPEANKLSALVNEKTLEKSIQASGELKQAIENNPRYQLLVKHARVLEGLARQPGMHAGGVIIAPGDVVKWSPLFKQSNGTDIVMTQFDMKVVESVGLIKMDFLGLRTLTVLQETCRLIKRYHDKFIDIWEDIPEGDEKTYELFGKGETTNVFQFESQGMQDYLRKLKPTCIEDIIAMAALYRPGPMNNIDSFIRRKHGKEEISYPHPMLREVLDVTYGIIVYQEQVMRIAQMMGGFSLGQADMLRKAMGKKMLDKMAEMEVRFLEGAKEKGIDQKAAKEVYALMSKFAEYGFNKAHATVYAHVSYQAAYLKTHYTLEYMTAALTSWIGKKEDFLTTKNEAERMNIKVLPPDVNRSEINCSIDEGNIRLGLGVIANVGKAAEAIMEAREQNGPFESIFDMCRKVDLKRLNKKSLECLISAGAMDLLPGTRAQQHAAIEQAVEYGNSFQKDARSGQTDLFNLGGDQQKESVISIPEPQMPDVAPWPYNELLGREKEVLNFYVSGHPLDNYRDEIMGFASLQLTESNMAEAKHDTSVTVGGIIISLRTHIQRDGRPMAFMELEDLSGSIELIAFGDAYETYRHLLATDSMVLVRGTVMREESRPPKLRVEKVMALAETRENLTRSVHIKMRTPGLEEEFIKEVFSHCTQHKGECRLIIHMHTQEANEYRIKAKNIMLNPAKEVIDALRKQLGKENVWLSKTAA
ncbi:MAG: DNA polymerase III subunit alpha [Chitinispirillaceae bacterium]